MEKIELKLIYKSIIIGPSGGYISEYTDFFGLYAHLILILTRQNVVKIWKNRDDFFKNFIQLTIYKFYHDLIWTLVHGLLYLSVKST